MNDELKTLKDRIESCKESVKTAKAALKGTIDDYARDSRVKVLKSAKTKLKTAKTAYKAAKPKGAIRQKASAVKEAIGNTARKIPVKKALTWTGLAITTVATGVGGYLLYDYFHKDGEATTGKDSM